MGTRQGSWGYVVDDDAAPTGQATAAPRTAVNSNMSTLYRDLALVLVP